MIAVTGRVLIVTGEPETRARLARIVRQESFEPLEAPDGERALAVAARQAPAAVVLDMRLPEGDGLEVLRRLKGIDGAIPVIVLSDGPTVEQATEALRAGALDYLVPSFETADLVRALHKVATDRRVQQRIRALSERSERVAETLAETMGPSEAVLRLIAQVQQVARSSLSVLIIGETGTGKELVARALHAHSARAAGPFVPVDCGAIPETLFESELFGHERGAFTGADRQRPGRFELAAGGTLFLDEIMNMPVGCQAKLLRALEDRQIVRVGGAVPIPVDVRVVAASNRNLVHSVTEGTFREDLFFRVNEFSIEISPLRERKEDILFLTRRTMDLTNRELGKSVHGLSPAAAERLLSYHWPGNVRQLRNVIRRAVLVADVVIEEDHLGLSPVPARPAMPVDRTAAPAGRVPLRQVVQRATTAIERATIAEVLRETGGNKARAARLLGVDYKTLQKKIRQYGICERDEGAAPPPPRSPERSTG